jgi:hypothetical protein
MELLENSRELGSILGSIFQGETKLRVEVGCLFSETFLLISIFLSPSLSFEVFFLIPGIMVDLQLLSNLVVV